MSTCSHPCMGSSDRHHWGDLSVASQKRRFGEDHARIARRPPNAIELLETRCLLNAAPAGYSPTVASTVPADYFPMIRGLDWAYSGTDNGQAATWSPDLYTDQVNGQNVFHLSDQESAASVTNEDEWLVNQNGLISWVRESASTPDVWYIFDFSSPAPEYAVGQAPGWSGQYSVPFTVSLTYPDRTTGSGSGTLSETLSVLGVQPVTLSNGLSFSQALVTQSQHTLSTLLTDGQSDVLQGTTTTWFVRGIGLVKEVDQSTDNGSAQGYTKELLAIPSWWTRSLMFTQQPQSARAGSVMGPIAVELRDDRGNLMVNDNSEVTLSVASGPGSLGGTTTVQAVNGVATFNNLVLTHAGTYTLVASDPTDNLHDAAVSNPFSVTSGPAAKLIIAQQPSGGVAGRPIVPGIAVKVKDFFGNIVADDSSAVTVSIASGPGTSFDPASTLTATAANGVATFNNVAIDRAGTYTLRFADGSLTRPVSSSFVVSHAPPSTLVFAQQPSNVKAGAAMAPAITVKIKDGFGNVCRDDTSTITLATATYPPKGRILTNPSVKVTGGMGTFSNISLNKAGTYTLSATDGALPVATSNSFTVARAWASKLVFLNVPSNAVHGVIVNPAITVAVTDAYGNLCGANTSTVTLNGQYTAVAVGGVATFDSVILGRPGTKTLTATDGLLTSAISAPLLVS